VSAASRFTAFWTTLSRRVTCCWRRQLRRP